MLILLTGLSGSGKTNTGYALMLSKHFKSITFIETEWFSARADFDWTKRTDIESLYQATEKLIDFHLNRGEENFVITLGTPMLKHDNEFIKHFEKGIPILLFCLSCEKDEIIRRVHERGRHEKQLQLELGAVNGDYDYLRNFISTNKDAFEINTTKTTEDQVATTIMEIIRETRLVQ